VLRGAEPDWLLAHLGGQFTVLLFAEANGIGANARAAIERARSTGVKIDVVVIEPNVPLECARSLGDAAAMEAMRAVMLIDAEGRVAERYDGAPGTVYLMRPDQHVCARWRQTQPDDIAHALARALGSAA
jgi:3-(3-hydroxy-phenyl)propionate hydroxylase